jgi:NAD(P)H dehydrogenase (quinone)
MSETASPQLLVTGANGKLGRLVIERLVAAGVPNVVAGSREPHKLPAHKGVLHRRADFDDPASLDAAFRGVDRVLVISSDRIDVPGLRIRQHRAAVDAAKRAGVKHLLYTSMLNPSGSFIPFAPDHLETENAIEASEMGFSILRVSWYAENLLASLPGILASGKWFTSAKDGRINHIPRLDVARAAAGALASRNGVRERFDITGPAPLRIAEIAAIASGIAGKPIEVVQVSDGQLAAGTRAAGVPEAFIPLVVGTDANIRAGKFDVASDAVKRLSGTAAPSLRDFLAANKAVWCET